MFQLDRGDLDFGLYRIMNLKSAEIAAFLDDDLLPQVKAKLNLTRAEDRALLTKVLANAREQAKASGYNPDRNPSPKIVELNRRLAEHPFLCGDDYTIADIANYGWYGALVLHNIYEAAEFLDVASYTHVIRWAEEIEARPAVQRGRRVNRPWGPEETRVPERHGPEDFD